MLKILAGNHSFLRQVSLVELKKSIALTPTVLRPEQLNVADFVDAISAQSLFESKCFLLIYDLSTQPELWQRMTELADEIINDETLFLVLVEDKVDARTKFIKEMLQKGCLENFTIDTDKNGRPRDFSGVKSIQFIQDQARKMNIKITQDVARALYDHVGADPWDLYHGLETLRVLNRFDKEVIYEYVPQNANVNVFEILGLSLRGERSKVLEKLSILEQNSTEPHQFFALLAGQACNLLSLSVAPQGVNVAADLGLNSFAVSALRSNLRFTDKNKLAHIVRVFAETDHKLKSGSLDIWLELRLLLERVAQINQAD